MRVPKPMSEQTLDVEVHTRQATEATKYNQKRVLPPRKGKRCGRKEPRMKHGGKDKTAHNKAMSGKERTDKKNQHGWNEIERFRQLHGN